MSYNWSLRRYWLSWIKSDISRFIYKHVYKINMQRSGTIIPSTGKGKFVSVYQKGKIIQIIDETGEKDEIRIIPTQYNHGVMVESIRDGKVVSRNSLDISQLNKSIIYASNIEALIDKKQFDRKQKLYKLNKNGI